MTESKPHSRLITVPEEALRAELMKLIEERDGLQEQLEAAQKEIGVLTFAAENRWQRMEEAEEQLETLRETATRAAAQLPEDPQRALDTLATVLNPARVPDGGQATHQEPSAPGDASGGTRVSDSPGVGSPASVPEGLGQTTAPRAGERPATTSFQESKP